jgi:ParB family transcriptional regulator, chromosome partitioning protein
MPKQRFGLGRGIEALIPSVTTIQDDTPFDSGPTDGGIFAVSVSAIMPNPLQPRMSLLGDEEFVDLVQSVREHGLLQPILLTHADRDEHGQRYYIIAGERRWRAAEQAGMDAVPAIIRETTPQMMLELALVENLQRTDLNPLEAARGYQMLTDEYGMTQDEVADVVGRSRPAVANTMRLLQLPEEVRDALITMPKVFTEGHARAVLQINSDVERIHAKNQIISQGLTVRQAEELARHFNEGVLGLTPDRHGARIHQQSQRVHDLQEEFMRAVEMKVRLQRSTKGKGSLTLYFTNDEQLQVLYDRLVAASGLADVDTASNGHSVLDVGSSEPSGGLERAFQLFGGAGDRQSEG